MVLGLSMCLWFIYRVKCDMMQCLIYAINKKYFRKYATNDDKKMRFFNLKINYFRFEKMYRFNDIGGTE
jgi:thiol-disulfide isomerase/thioredoxin